MIVRSVKSLVLLGLIFSLPLTAAGEGEGAAKTNDACVIPLTTLESELLAAGVDDDYASTTFASLKPVGLSQLITYTLVQRFIDEVDGDLKGYYLHGESKVGKTKFAVAAARKVASEQGLPLIYITHANVNRIWEGGAPESLAKYDVIVFDGLLDRPKNELASARMLLLFEAAVEIAERSKTKKILATSRLGLEDLVEKMFPDRKARWDFDRKAFSIFQPAKLLAN